MNTSVLNNEGGNTEVINAFVLHQNYPNPFNSSTVISYFIQKPGHVTLSILDITGRKVATIINEYQARGYHKILWKPDDSQPSGVYYYQIISNNYTKTKKCILLK